MSILGNKTRILYGFYDMSGDTYEWEISQTVGETEKTVLNSQAMEYVPNIVDGSLTFNGYLKVVDANLVENRLNNVLASGTESVAVLMNYQFFPSPAMIFPNSFNNSIAFSSSVNELLTFNGGIRSRSAILRGHTICYSKTVTVTGADPSVQIPSIVSSNTGTIFFFLHNFTGTFSSNATVQVQSSSNNSTFTTNATFTTNEEKSIFSITNPPYAGSYIRANVTSLGGSSSLTYSIIVTKN